MSVSSWVIVAVLCMVVEILTPGVFFFACLAIGAFCAGICGYLTASSWIMWVVFFCVSILSMYFIRPVARKLFKVTPRKSNVDSLIGMKACVVEKIDPPHLGMVKVEGELWKAESDKPVGKGSDVVVLSISGTRLKVN